MQRTKTAALLVFALLSAGCVATAFPAEVTDDTVNQSATVIANSDSFTYEQTRQFNDEETRTVITYNQTTEQGVITVYQNGEVQQRQYRTAEKRFTQGSDGDVTIRNVTTNFSSSPSRESVRGQFFDFAGNASERVNITEFNGDTVGVYELTGDEAKAVFPGVQNNVTLTTYASANGRIVYQKVATEQGSAVRSFTGVNETTVERPPWVDEASQ